MSPRSSQGAGLLPPGTRPIKLALLCLLLLLGGSCASEVGWKPGTCDKQLFAPLLSTPHWARSQQQGGLPVCLRVSWADGRRSQTTAARLGSQGEITAADGSLQLTFSLPAEAKDQQLSFQLLGLGRGSEPQSTCLAAMSQPGYICQGDPDGECWFVLDFEPEFSKGQARVKKVEGGCRLSTLPQVRSEPSSVEGVAPEPPKPQEQSTPDARLLESSPPEPRPVERKPTESPVREGPVAFTTLITGGGSSGDVAYGVAVGQNGDVFATGSFQGAATFSNGLELNATGRSDVFVLKLSASGKLQGFQSRGSGGAQGTSLNVSYGIATDPKGNAYVAGKFQGSVGFGSSSLQATSASAQAFVAKLSPSGAWTWASSVSRSASGVSSSSVIYDIAYAQQLLYVVGTFKGKIQFGAGPALSSIKKQTGGDTRDIFVACMDLNGNWLWSISATSTADNEANAVAVFGNAIYVAGTFRGDLADFGGLSAANANQQSEAFVASLKARMNGSQWVASWDWVATWGGENSEQALDVAVGSDGNIYVAGEFQRGKLTYRPPRGAVKSITATHQGNNDVFVAKIKSDGDLDGFQQIGGTGDVRSPSVALDPSDNVYVAGSFSGAMTLVSSTMTSTGVGGDLFVAKFGAKRGAWEWVVLGGGKGGDLARAAAFSRGIFWLVGGFSGSSSFGNQTQSSNGALDAFIWGIRTP